MPARYEILDDLQDIKDRVVYSIQDFFQDGLSQFLTEIQLGVRDNLYGIKFLVTHPITSVEQIVSSLRHPIKTFKKLSKFASKNPTRYWTNLLLSYLEGRAITAVAPNLNVLQEFYDLGNDIMPITLRDVLKHDRLILFAIPEEKNQKSEQKSKACALEQNIHRMGF
ncbi:MAG TPA: hypothetical protein VFP93_02050 [Gammaproteobacteria bacterium]|nr:hypothetical protein [Gammaproteobacteria bacterium]